MSELADRTDGAVGKSVIANIETGRKQDVTVAQLAAISSGLCVPLVALLTDLDEMNDQAPPVFEVSRIVGITDPVQGVAASPLVSDVLSAHRELIQQERSLQRAHRDLVELRRRREKIKPGSPPTPDTPRTDEDMLFDIVYDEVNLASTRRRRAIDNMEAASQRLATAMGNSKKQTGGTSGAAADTVE